MNQQEAAAELRRLHQEPPVLTLVNVWDVASARAVAALPGCRAIATASHAIANSLGYEDGQHIPVQTMIEAVERIAAAVELPVTADLEAGYGDPGDTIRRAIGVGVVGANLEDAMAPLDASVQAVRAAVAAAEDEGLDFVLNARTDVYLQPGGRTADEQLAEAITRGRAFLDAGAACVFVPGRLDAATAAALVEGIGVRKVSVLAGPGSATPAELEAAGIARISYGPWPYRAALTAVADLAAALFDGASLPQSIRNFG